MNALRELQYEIPVAWIHDATLCSSIKKSQRHEQSVVALVLRTVIIVSRTKGSVLSSFVERENNT